MKKSGYIQEFEFRPRPLPTGDMPLGLKGAGRYRSPRGKLIAPDICAHLWVGWCASGLLKAAISGTDTHVRAAQVIVITPDTQFGVSVIKKPGDLYWCAIDGSDAGIIASKLGLETGVFNCDHIPREIITNWIEKLPSQSERVERELSTAAYELLYRLAKDIKTKNSDPVFIEIVNYISNNFEDSELTIDSIAEHFGLHRSTLSNMFKRYTDSSPKGYITDKRLNKAEQLLMSTDDKISDISLVCGFNDPNYFSRMFRKGRGMTPREYREALSVK